MKARIKATGEVVEGVFRDGVTTFYSRMANRNYKINEVELISEIDWEQREWDATVAILGGINRTSTNESDIRWAMKRAKALVAEYRKGE